MLFLARTPVGESVAIAVNPRVGETSQLIYSLSLQQEKFNPNVSFI